MSTHTTVPYEFCFHLVSLTSGCIWLLISTVLTESPSGEWKMFNSKQDFDSSSVTYSLKALWKIWLDIQFETGVSIPYSLLSRWENDYSFQISGCSSGRESMTFSRNTEICSRCSLWEQLRPLVQEPPDSVIVYRYSKHYDMVKWKFRTNNLIDKWTNYTSFHSIIPPNRILRTA